jgi:hypothetical protein
VKLLILLINTFDFFIGFLQRKIDKLINNTIITLRIKDLKSILLSLKLIDKSHFLYYGYKTGYSVRRVIIMASMKLLYGSCASSFCVLLVWFVWVGSVIVVLFPEEFIMNKEQIAAEIKKTEEQLTRLRQQLEQPEYPTLSKAKAGNKLENGCIVVYKFSEVRMALIAAPCYTECHSNWSEEFSDVFDALVSAGFNRSQWFIPNIEQLQLACNNCEGQFSATFYWSSTEASSTNSCVVNFGIGNQGTVSKSNTICVRAFSLVSY